MVIYQLCTKWLYLCLDIFKTDGEIGLQINGHLSDKKDLEVLTLAVLGLPI